MPPTTPPSTPTRTPHRMMSSIMAPSRFPKPMRFSIRAPCERGRPEPTGTTYMTRGRTRQDRRIRMRGRMPRYCLATNCLRRRALRSRSPPRNLIRTQRRQTAWISISHRPLARTIVRQRCRTSLTAAGSVGNTSQSPGSLSCRGSVLLVQNGLEVLHRAGALGVVELFDDRGLHLAQQARRNLVDHVHRESRPALGGLDSIVEGALDARRGLVAELLARRVRDCLRFARDLHTGHHVGPIPAGAGFLRVAADVGDRLE